MLAAASQNNATELVLDPALREGRNVITIVGQNGPASFAGGGCGARGCTYTQNPAGVVFGGGFEWP